MPRWHVNKAHRAAWVGELNSLASCSYGELASPGPMGVTPLHLAAYEGHLNVCSYLVSRGVTVAAVDETDLDPLRYASLRGHQDVVQLLLSYGPGQQTLRDGFEEEVLSWSPVHLAILSGDAPTVQALVEKGGATTVTSSSAGLSSLHFAIASRNLHLLEILSKPLRFPEPWFCDWYDNEYSPLGMASSLGLTDVVRFILNQDGVNPNIPSGPLNQPPLENALNHGHTEVAELLIERGANKADRPSPSTFPHASLPLHQAVEAGDLDRVQQLVGSRASSVVLEEDSSGYTALHYAAFYDRAEIARYLCQQGGVALGKRSGATNPPLTRACIEGHLDTAKAIVEQLGPNLLLYESKSVTALEMADHCGQVPVLSWVRDTYPEVFQRERARPGRFIDWLRIETYNSVSKLADQLNEAESQLDAGQTEPVPVVRISETIPTMVKRYLFSSLRLVWRLKSLILLAILVFWVLLVMMTPTPPQSEIFVNQGYYVYSYDAQTRNPSWVLQRIWTVQEGCKKITWTTSPDPELPPDLQTNLSDYTRSDFVPGQLLAPSCISEETTAYISTCSPMNREFHDAFWAPFLSQTGELLKNSRHGFGVSISGPLVLPSPAKEVQYRVISDSRIQVPSHFFRILYLTPTKSDAIAWVFPNEPIDPSKNPEDFRVPLDKVEEMIGLQLPDNLLLYFPWMTAVPMG